MGLKPKPIICDLGCPCYYLQTSNVCVVFFARILLRVKLLFFLRHEVIGTLGHKIREGCNARFVKPVCDKCRLQTCKLAGKRSGKHCCDKLCSNKFFIPETSLFKDLNFRDVESIRAFHNNVYPVHLPVCSLCLLHTIDNLLKP